MTTRWKNAVAFTLSAVIGLAGMVSIAPPASAAANVQITPGDLDFGSVNVGAGPVTLQQTMYVTGTSTVDTRGIQITGPGADAFTVQSNSCDTRPLIPGTFESFCLFDVVFTPGQPGVSTATLQANYLEEDTAQLGSVTVSLRGEVTVPYITASEDMWDFGTVPLGASTDTSITFTSDGDGVATITSVELMGPNAGEFAITQNACTGTLAVSSTCDTTVTFAPTSVGAKNVELVLNYDDTTPVLISFSGAGSPNPMSATPSSLDFGQVMVGDLGGPLVTTLTDVSGDTTISSVAVTGTNADQFTLPGFCAPVASGVCDRFVMFAPTSAGVKNAELSVHWVTTAGVGGTTIIPVTGTGTPGPTLELSTPSHNFGSVEFGLSSTTQLTLTNAGGGTLDLNDIQFNGANTDAFTLLGEVCTAPLSSGQNCTMTVSFTPQTSGPASAALEIVTSSGTSNFPVTGTGVPIAAVATPINAGDVWVQGVTTATGTITNIGGGGNVTIQAVSTGLSQNGAFDTPQGQCSSPTVVAEGDTCTFTVDVEAFDLGAFSSYVVVQWADAAGNTGTINVPVIANGITAPNVTPTPYPFDFGDVTVGTTVSKVLTFTNTGGDGGQASEINLSNYQGFALGTDSCIGVTLSAGASCAVTISFTPTATGAQTSTVRYYSPVTYWQDVPVTGVGVLAAVTPMFDAHVPTGDGFTVKLLNYDPSFNWAVESSAGTAVLDVPAGIVTVSALPAGGSATVTATVTRPGYATGTRSMVGTAIPAVIPSTPPVSGPVTFADTGSEPTPQQTSQNGGMEAVTVIWRLKPKTSVVAGVPAELVGKQAVFTINTNKPERVTGSMVKRAKKMAKKYDGVYAGTVKSTGWRSPRLVAAYRTANS